MPKNQVSDPITDQEIAFARMILSGTVTDRQAAESAGLNPDTAAYTKAKPRVRAYLLERRAAINEQLDQQETDARSRQTVSREQVLARLWEIANLSPEATRNSATAQIKALSLIIAIEGLIPDRRAAASQKKPAFPPVTEDFYRSEWYLEKQEMEPALQPDPVVPRSAEPPAVIADNPPDPAATPIPDADVAPAEYIRAYPASFGQTKPWAPHAFISSPAPDPDAPFSIRKNPFTRP